MTSTSDAWGRTIRWLPVFVVAAGVRAAYWVLVAPEWIPNADADQYVRLSRSLADGRGFGLIFPQMDHHPTAFRPPLYPALLTPGAWAFENALWPARVVNVVIGALVVVLAGVLAARIAGRRAGLCTAGVVALYPPLLANDTVTLTEPLALALMLGAVLLVDSQRWRWAAMATGAILLTRPNGYLVVAILGFWCYRAIGRRQAAGFVLISIAVLAPWLVRNQIQVGTWRPTTSDGFTMAAIYAPPAQAEGAFVDPVYSRAYDGWKFRLAQFDEAEWNSILSREAVDGVRSNPGYVFHVLQRNARSFFELAPELNFIPELNDGRNLHFVDRTRPIFYVVSVAGLVGLWRNRRDRRIAVLAALAAQFAVLSLLLVAPPRLRAPIDLVLALGAGLLIAELSRGPVLTSHSNRDWGAPGQTSASVAGDAAAKI